MFRVSGSADSNNIKPVNTWETYQVGLFYKENQVQTQKTPNQIKPSWGIFRARNYTRL